MKQAKQSAGTTALIIGEDELYSKAVKKLFNLNPGYDTVYFYEPSHSAVGSVKNDELVQTVKALQADEGNTSSFAIARNLKTAVAASNTIVCLSPKARSLVMNTWVQPGTKVVSSWGSYDETWIKGGSTQATSGHSFMQSALRSA